MNNISFFRFPKNKDFCCIWLVKCARKDKINITARLCSLHFTEDQFERNLRNELLNREIIQKILKNDAIPLTNLPIGNNPTKSDRQKRHEIKICRKVMNNDAM